MELSNSKIPDLNTISIPSSKHQYLKNINHIYILAINLFSENATAVRCICGSTPANYIRRPRTLFADVIVFTFLLIIYISHVSVYLNICFLRLHTTFTCYLHQFIPVTRYIPVICYLCQHHRTVI